MSKIRIRLTAIVRLGLFVQNSFKMSDNAILKPIIKVQYHMSSRECAYYSLFFSAQSPRRATHSSNCCWLASSSPAGRRALGIHKMGGILEAIANLFLFFYYIIQALVLPWIPIKYRSKDISGQIALVTGAGGGIGRLLALGLAKQGCKVVCWVNSRYTCKI